jgi:hypothetical protein
MSTPVRQPPRFVPTLTEVVDPLAFTAPSTAQADIDVETLMATIWQQVQPKLALRLQQETEQWLRATLAQHLHDINARVQSDMEPLVRQAVMDALKTQNRPDPDAAPVNN